MDTAKTSHADTSSMMPDDAAPVCDHPESQSAANDDATRGVLDTDNPFAEHADSVSDVAPLLQTPEPMPTSGPRPMNKGRFATGLMFAASGMALMLVVAFGTMQNAGGLGRLSLPAIGLCMVIGLMLLGGGFGVMATSAGTFDDGEFERLMQGQAQPLRNQTAPRPNSTAASLAAFGHRDESAA